MAAFRLHKTADGVGATFPDDILDQLKLGDGDILDIRKTPDGILLTPLEAPRAEVVRVARRLMEENAAVLRALAK